MPFLATLLLSVVISFSIMENTGNFGLIIIMAILFFLLSAYTFITKRCKHKEIPFEFNMFFGLIFGGTITGTVIFGFYKYFELIANLIFS